MCGWNRATACVQLFPSIRHRKKKSFYHTSQGVPLRRLTSAQHFSHFFWTQSNLPRHRCALTTNAHCNQVPATPSPRTRCSHVFGVALHLNLQSSSERHHEQIDPYRHRDNSRAKSVRTHSLSHPADFRRRLAAQLVCVLGRSVSRLLSFEFEDVRQSFNRLPLPTQMRHPP